MVPHRWAPMKYITWLFPSKDVTVALLVTRAAPAAVEKSKPQPNNLGGKLPALDRMGSLAIEVTGLHMLPGCLVRCVLLSFDFALDSGFIQNSDATDGEEGEKCVVGTGADNSESAPTIRLRDYFSH